MACPLSVVIPALNEVMTLPRLLGDLSAARERAAEIIVVDGGSADGTLAAVRGRADQVLTAPCGRASQLGAGVEACSGEVVWLLHADSRIEPTADQHLLWGLQRSGRSWGRFDVRLDGNHPLLRMVETGMNVRSRLTGIATGDQGIFVRRDVLDRAGGVPEQPLMEDVALSKRLKRAGPPVCLRERIAASARQWEKHGVARTIVFMWRLRLAYVLGVAPAALHRQYYGE